MSADDEPERTDEVLAAEYALGVLDADEREECRERLQTDAAFAAAVRVWQARFEPLGEEYGEVRPPAGAFGRIEARLFGRKARVPGRLGALWSSITLWRGIAAAAVLAVAVVLALGSPFDRPVDDAGTPMVAALDADDRSLRVVAFYRPETDVLHFARLAGAPDAGRDFELWYIKGEAAPVSLGVLPHSDRGMIPVPPAIADRLDAGDALAISDEPAGGSPTGSVTGPVLAVAEIRPL